MDIKEIGELLSRIDERTKNIESRQKDEIGDIRLLSDRISGLENWRNFLAGAYGTVILGLTAVGVYARNRH